jgi:hypothetical protein
MNEHDVHHSSFIFDYLLHDQIVLNIQINEPYSQRDLKTEWL